MMETIHCILCESREMTEIIAQRDINLAQDERTFSIVRCAGCGLMFLSPRPTKAEIGAFYPKEYYPLEEPKVRRSVDRFFKRLSSFMKKGIREEFYGYPGPRYSGLGRLLRRILLFPEYLNLRLAGRDMLPFRGNGRILDVGCGPGRTLRDLQSQGWDVYGVDFSHHAVEYARRVHGLNVRLGELHEAKYEDGFFDVVMFSHCLEHLFDPLETLAEARRILKPGGLLVIYVPNAGGFEAWIFGKWWVQWDAPRHLFHFTKTTMAGLIERAGFRLVQIRDGTTKTFFLGSVDMVYKWVLKSDRKHGSVIQHLVAKPFCLLASLLGAGSEMRVYAEKPAAE